eukprot:TRINITY_DN18795_c0_g1_i1.p1 TRINITY_DN18795_c0_g1~~TRINITY_DN18795_c0_g1_i1.p1  ORF type:complete len:251 (-),score=40.15 TRINITY_DN18795_c0_g1_i1:517-1200(-)
MAECMKLGYWKIRGLASPIRMLLYYAGQAFQEDAYELGDDPTFDASCWLSKKFTLDLAFPNLPYLLDGPVRVTQSSAILRHIARKHNLAGSRAEEQTLVDMLAEELVDLRRMYMFVYSPECKEALTDFAEKVPKQLGKWEDFLTGDSLVGTSFTYVDFMAAEIFDVISKLVPGALDSFPKVKKLHDEVFALPQLKEYWAHEGTWPINNKIAYMFGGWRETEAGQTAP